MNYDLTISSLQDRGHRLTKVRKEIVKIFSEKMMPLSVNDLASILEKTNLPVNKATIYREVQFLLSHSLLKEVFLYPNEVSYESAELKHHHHLVCEKCGHIDNVTNCLASDLEADVYKKKSFKITRHTLELYGICQKCAQHI